MQDAESKEVTPTPEEPPDVKITLTRHGKQQIEGIVSRNRQEPKRLTVAERDRMRQLADDLNAHVFGVIDAEPEDDGEAAGRIAKAVEQAFERAYRAEFGHDGEGL